MSSLSDRISELRKRVSDIGSQLGKLADRRKSYAWAASDRDGKAMKEIGDIDYQVDSLMKEQATINSALEVGEALERQHALEIQQRADRDRDEKAYTTARAVITLNEELDLELGKLRDMFERRAALLQQLANTGLVDVGFINKLSGKSSATRAACAAGLHRFLSLETPAPGSMVSLSSSVNPTLLGIGRQPDDEPELKRVRLKAAP